MKPIKVTAWFSLYTAPKVCTLTRTGTGVYLIRDKQTRKIVYVGKSHTDAKNTLYRHFQTWTDHRSREGRQYTSYSRVTYKGEAGRYQARVLFTASTQEADNLEQVLIIKLQPRDNSRKLELFTPSQVARVQARVRDAEDCPF